MANAFPIRFPDQLRQHLRALRKRQGLTQAQLGALVGVSQARIAEIEANPGLVNFEQLMKLLTVLGVTVTLHEDASAPAQTAPTRTTAALKPHTAAQDSKTPISPRADKNVQSPTRASFLVRPKKGSW